MTFPDRCSIVRGNVRCPNPPVHAVSIRHGSDEYMVGVACDEHQRAVSENVRRLQERGTVPSGTVGFTMLKPVGTDCIRRDPDQTIQIDAGARDG